MRLPERHIQLAARLRSPTPRCDTGTSPQAAIRFTIKQMLDWFDCIEMADVRSRAALVGRID